MRSDLLLHGLEWQKNDWIATTGLAQAVFPGVFDAKLTRGGRGVDWLAPEGSFHAMGPFFNQNNAQSWPFVVLNSLAKVNKNEVITFERLKISLKSCMGPLGLGQRPGKSLRLVSKTNPLAVFFLWAVVFILNTRRLWRTCSNLHKTDVSIQVQVLRGSD